MPRKPQKALERIRNSSKGGKREELERLYKGYGFQITGSGPHDKVRHPEYPQLITFLPRHKQLAPAYFKEAIRLIDRLEELKKNKEGSE